MATLRYMYQRTLRAACTGRKTCTHRLRKPCIVETDRGCDWRFSVFRTFINMYNSPKRHFYYTCYHILRGPYEGTCFDEATVQSLDT